MDDGSTTAQLRLLKIYAAFTYPFACVPFLYFYFRDYGITVAEYTVMISVYYVTMVVAEIPTGVLADRHGKRLAMVIGPILLAAGFAIIWAFHGFAAFCVGEAVFGIGHSILSGPPSALLYDRLQRNGRTEEFLVQESRMQAMRLFGTGGSFLIGGFVAHWFGIGPTILLTAGLCAVGGVVAIFVRDVPRSGEAPRRILQDAGRDLRRPSILWILAYFVLVFALLRYCFHTYQPFLEEAREEGTILIGTLFFAMNLVAAPCSRLVPRLARSFGERTLFWMMPLALALSLLVLAGLVERIGVLLFFVHQVPFGLHWSLIQSFVNHRIEGDARATVLSVMSFVGRLSFAALFPLAGLLHDSHGVSTTYLVVGASGVVATFVCMRAGRRFVS